MGLVGRPSSQADSPGSVNPDYNLEEDPLVTEGDMAEVEGFLEAYPELTKDYIPIAVIGEGTFSTVFKAIDVNYYTRDNSAWQVFSRQDPDDTSKILTYFARMAHTVKTRSTKRALGTPVNQAIRQFVLAQYCGLPAGAGAGPLDPEQTVDMMDLQAKFARFPPQCVAIKRINATSGPRRIAEEMSFLGMVGGRAHVIPVISGMRHEDQVLLVFPFFRGEDFREFMLSATAADIADYMRLLLEALAHLHEHRLIHRDVKPSNFLFARRTAAGPAAAVLLDFGLAQMEDPEVTSGSIKTSRTFTAKKMESIARLRASLEKYPPGIIINDPRQHMRASRAGTRGFRAPEVLFKIPHQSTLIDVWSAGVILLTLLARRYPFFQSNDDSDAILEIAAIFGNAELEAAARAYHRSWRTNVASVPPAHLTFRRLVRRLAPETFEELPEAFDLLERLLKLVVTERCSAHEALQHPFFARHAAS